MQKYQRSKLEIKNKIADSARFDTEAPTPRAKLVDVFLQSCDRNQCLVPHLKSLFHICLEPEAHGNGMTFRVCNVVSKQPHLYSAYLVSVAFQLHTTVCTF